MFSARLKEASTLKKVVDAIKDLVNEANFLCTSDGLQMQAMDKSHVALICLTMLSEGFVEYDCPSDFTLGLNVSLLSKILKCAENNDSLRLEADADGECLNVTFESPNGQRTSTFEVRRMDIDGEQIEIPDTEYQCSVKMPCSQFKKVVGDLSLLGETCSLEVKKGEVVFSLSSEVGGNAQFALKEDKTAKREMDQTAVDVDEDDRRVKMAFAVSYLSQFAKTSGISEQVGIFMSDGMPLYITYDMGEVGSVGYYLAPKIMGDD